MLKKVSTIGCNSKNLLLMFGIIADSSAGSAVTKVTSTPLLEFLKTRRADKLRSKEDKVAERKKREMERRKAREDARNSIKQQRASEGDGDAGPQVKVQKHLHCCFLVGVVLQSTVLHEKTSLWLLFSLLLLMGNDKS